jgi:tight adherence protein C
VIVAMVLGGAVGAGIAVAAFALAPVPPPLRSALLALHRPPRPVPVPPAGVPAPLFGLARSLGADRLLGARLGPDLRITGRDEMWLVSSVMVLGICGVAIGPALAAVALVAGVDLPWGIPVAMSLVAGPVAGLAQVLAVRSDASRRRREFAFALSAYLDLVVVSMAAGRGTEGALSVAAETGAGPAFDALRTTLEGARLRGIAPWDALDELGARLGVTELCGLAASIRLAGASGARVRASLAARATSLRERGLADARAVAESDTERMSVPVVLLVLGFMILISYPAVVQITSQL